MGVLSIESIFLNLFNDLLESLNAHTDQLRRFNVQRAMYIKRVFLYPVRPKIKSCFSLVSSC